MSTVQIMKQFNSMKKRYGWPNPPRFALMNHSMRSCPGNIHHGVVMNLPPMRKMRLFDRHVVQGHKAYVTFWRSHPVDFRRYKSW